MMAGQCNHSVLVGSEFQAVMFKFHTHTHTRTDAHAHTHTHTVRPDMRVCLQSQKAKKREKVFGRLTKSCRWFLSVGGSDPPRAQRGCRYHSAGKLGGKFYKYI